MIIMADKQSREEAHKPSEKALEVRRKILRRNLEHCFNLTPEQVDTVIALSKENDEPSNQSAIKLSADVSHALKGLKAVQREARETVKALKEVEELKNHNLLVITLEDEASVPKVFYKGEEIQLKKEIYFNWETETEDHFSGGLTYMIEHFETGAVPPATNRIERRAKGHVFD